MTLTKDDEILLAAAGLTVALAYQQGPKHIATAQGAAFYHLPVGSVIIPHPHNPGVSFHGYIPEDKWKEGEAEWIAKGEAIWKANEWKGHGHRVVYVGHNAYAVPGDAKVWVLKDTDLSNDQDVVNAPKYVTVGTPGAGTSGNIGTDGQLHGGQFTAGAQQALEKDWKEVPAGQAKMPVAVEGKIIAWVPQDWQIYVHAGGQASAAKIGIDPQGQYHVINSFGMSGKPAEGTTLSLIKGWISKGTYKQETAPGQTSQDKAHVPPAESASGPQEPKVHAGGIPVSKDELHEAIGILKNDKSTNVKLPLKKHGHPLQHMDYTGVAKDELAKHPELKVSQGTKKQHVGHVKNAVIHHLSGLADKMHADEAQAAVAKQAAEEAEAKAAHAKALTPGTFEFAGADGGTISATAEEIKAAADYFANSSPKATAKQIFSGKTDIGPLAQIDFWKVVGDWKDEHPEDKKLKPKVIFAKALSAAIADTGAQDEESGHTGASKLHDIISNGQYAGPGPHVTSVSAPPKLAEALVSADELQQPAYVAHVTGNPLMGDGWGISYGKPSEGDYYEVTPEHKVAFHNAATGGDVTISEATVEHWAEQNIKPAPEPGEEKPPEPIVLEMKPEFADPAPPTGKDYQELHELAEAADLTKTDDATDTSSAWSVISLAFLMAATSGTPWYVKQKDGGYWTTTNEEPPMGMPGAPAADYWKLTPAHSVIIVNEQGTHTEVPSGVALTFFKEHLKLKEPGDGQGTEPVSIAGKVVGQVPAGSQVYYAPSHLAGTGGAPETTVLKYIKAPDGSWYKANAAIGVLGPLGPITAGVYDKHVSGGTYKLLSEAKAPDEPAKDPFSIVNGPGIKITVNGMDAGYAPEGSVIYTGNYAKDPDNAVKYVKWPDGSWYYYNPESDLHHSDQVQGQTLADGGHLKTLEELKAEPEAPAGTKFPPMTFPVTVKGNVVGNAPAGSQVYYSVAHVTPGQKPEDVVDTLYIKTPAGVWLVAQPHTGVHDVDGTTLSGKSYDSLIEDGAFKVLGEEPGIPVFINGKLSGTVPSGSKFFTYPNSKNPGVVYAKLPDGQWVRVGTAYGVGTPKPASYYDKEVESGTLTEFAEPPGTAVTWTPEPQGGLDAAEEPEAEAPGPTGLPGDPVHILFKGKLLTETLPPGSKIYKKPGDDYYWYGRAPDGTWYRIDSYGIYKQSETPNGKQHDATLQAGKYKEVPAATPETIAQAKAVEDLTKQIKNGAMASVTEAATWQPVIVSDIATDHHKGYVHASNSSYAVLDPGTGTWSHSFHVPDKAKEYVAVKETEFEGTHHFPDGHEEPVAFAEFKQAVDEHLTPDAVQVEGKLYKYGFYYKPKGKAGTYLEVKASSSSSNYGYHNTWKYGTGAKATYVWHGVDSAKEITPNAALKHLAVSEFYPEAQPFVPGAVKTAVSKPKYVTVAAPGTYTLFQEDGGTPVSGLVLKIDGSGVLSTPGSADAPVGEPVVETLLKSGSVVDAHGNTVVKPGIEPTHYHLFGKYTLTAEKAKQFAAALDEVYDAEPGASPKPAIGVLGDYLPGFTSSGEAKNNAFAFWKATVGSQLTWSQQSSSISKLIKEMGLVPENHFAIKAPEVKYLKGLPPGIHSSKDVFETTGKGWAKPFSGVLGEQVGDSVYIGSMTKPELAAKIKEVSQQFGDGKVVGTHASSLTKDAQVAWLDAWGKGEMADVFELDASGGKVSPAHPGAPGNPDTHKVTWAPWGEGQLPAGTVPENEAGWTGLGVDMPKAEVANYLIKAGLQHAEFLTDADRRKWVKLHRNGQQAIVDLFSRTAFDRWLAHDNPLSEPLKWTDDLKPAMAYDVHLEEKKPAQSWPSIAQSEFLTDFANDPMLVKAIAEVKAENSYPYNYQFIQKYLDAKEAAELAEKLKPRYHVTGEAPEGGFGKVIADQFGHRYLFDPGMGEEQRNTILAAHALARTWGFKTPRAAMLTTEDGETGLARALPDGTPLSEVPGFWTGTPDFGTLTQRQVSDIAREQVLDWALGNPLSGPQNMLRTDDGSVVGTDKAGAFKMDWDGLGPGADSQVKQASSALLHAIQGHGIGKDIADQAYADAVRTAFRMSQLSDVRAEQLVTEHLGAVPEGLLARKDALLADVTKAWQAAYKAAGWKLPEVAPEKLSHGLHSGFSEPSFFDHVIASKNAGAPAFFSGTELEDGNFLVWTEMSGENRLVNGESALLGPALEKIQAWAEANQADINEEKQPDIPDLHGNKAGITGEHSFHTRIIAAAKSVSRHAQDQLWAGPVTTQALQGMADAKTELLERLALAEAAQAGDQAAKEAFEALHSNLAYNLNMTKYYLGLIQKVEEAKATAGTFKPGELPRWWLPKTMYPAGMKKPDKPKVKVELRSAYRTLNKHQALGTETNAGHGQDPVPGGYILDPEDGELHLGTMTYEYPGKAWYITLPTGEVIEINDTGKTGTHAAHQGRIRFRANAADGAASLERIRAQLQDMGLGMEEAQLPDMELLYWRMLAHTLAERVDRTEGKHKTVWTTIASAPGITKNTAWQPSDLHKLTNAVAEAHLPQDEEVALWRKAWGALTTPQQVQQWTDAQGFMPHLGHFDVKNPEVTGGKPFWYRFDATPEALGKLKLGGHSLGYKAKTDVSAHVVRTGQLSSTEARLRALGIWRPGKSSVTDMSKGSSGTVFIRLNHESGQDVLIHPRVIARIHTYGFDGDRYGDITKRATESYFDLATAAARTGSSNETDIKDTISLLDDLEFVKVGSEAVRQTLIAELKAAGVTEIRGVPVEQRLVTDITSGMLAQAHQRLKAEGEAMLAHPENVYVAPPSAVVKHAAITTEAEEAAYEASVADAGEKETTVDHSGGSPEEAVSQVFYQQPSKDPQASSPAVAGKVKGGMAKRVSAQMSSTDEEVTAFYKAAGLHAPESWGGTPRDRTIAAMVATWAQGNSSPVALALQNRASQVFSLAKDPLPPLGYANAESEAAAHALEEGYGQVIDDFLAAMWTLTQQDMTDAGIGQVTLYRILRFSGEVPQWVQDAKAGDVIDSPAARPMSSWAFSQSAAETAATFTMGGAKAVVVKATMPRELLLSFPRSGLGCYNEGEFVALDAKGKLEIVKVSG